MVYFFALIVMLNVAANDHYQSNDESQGVMLYIYDFTYGWAAILF